MWWHRDVGLLGLLGQGVEAEKDGLQREQREPVLREALVHAERTPSWPPPDPQVLAPDGLSKGQMENEPTTVCKDGIESWGRERQGPSLMS